MENVVTDKVKVIRLTNFLEDFEKVLFDKMDTKLLVVPPNAEWHYEWIKDGLETTVGRVCEVFEIYRKFRKEGIFPDLWSKEKVAYSPIRRKTLRDCVEFEDEFWVYETEYDRLKDDFDIIQNEDTIFKVKRKIK